MFLFNSKLIEFTLMFVMKVKSTGLQQHLINPRPCLQLFRNGVETNKIHVNDWEYLIVNIVCFVHISTTLVAIHREGCIRKDILQNVLNKCTNVSL
jgi:hypothetical protein